MMRRSIFLKSSLRQPIRNLPIFLLVGVICYSFSMRIGEYLLVDQGIDQLSDYYHSVGSLELLRDHANEDALGKYLSVRPDVKTVNWGTTVSAVIQDGFYNGDTNGITFSEADYANGSRMYINNIPVIMDQSYNNCDVFFYGKYISHEGTTNFFRFEIDEVLTGYPEYVSKGKLIALVADQEELGDGYSILKNGERYLVRASFDAYDLNCLDHENYSVLLLKPLANHSPWFISAPENIDLSQPQYTQISEDIQKVHDNSCAFSLMGNKDVSARIDVQVSEQENYLVEGRWPNKEDDETGNRVIAIHESIAVAQGLSIGDTITLKLREGVFTGIYQGLLKITGAHDEMGATQTETYKIVGVYRNLSSEHLNSTLIRSWPYTYAQTYMYVPYSTIPETFNADRYLSSIVLISPVCQSSFLAETQADLAAMGYRAVFLENGYESFRASTEGILTAARNNVLIFGVILAMALTLVCFVYFRFRRRDLAISRALGVPAGRCVIGSALPLVLVGGIGIIGGAALAWSYTRSHAGELLGAITAAAGVEEAAVTLSTGSLALLCTILLFALLALALLFAAVTVKKPVLALLQGGKSKK